MSKKKAEMIEGPEAYKRFDATMKTLLAVPREVFQKRLKEFKEKIEKYPEQKRYSEIFIKNRENLPQQLAPLTEELKKK